MAPAAPPNDALLTVKRPNLAPDTLPEGGAARKKSREGKDQFGV